MSLPLYTTYISVMVLNNRVLGTQNSLRQIFLMHWSNFHNTIEYSCMDESETSDDSNKTETLGFQVLQNDGSKIETLGFRVL